VFHFQDLVVPKLGVQMPKIYNETFIGVNPAAFGVWYGMKHSEEWRL